ncbi:hypothetical protein CLOM_g11821, partial [Closterium sp. NIES-68]
QGVCQNIP